MTLPCRPPPPADTTDATLYSRSSHRLSFDIVKTAVVSTDSQIGTLGTFRCQYIQNFPAQNSAGVDDTDIKGGRVLAFDGANAGRNRRP
jgi:hypothetical protein